MKICPNCQSKYTDDSLKFCLQDGGKLNTVRDDKTLELKQEFFADDKTIVDKVGTTLPNDAQKTEAFSNSPTIQIDPPENLSEETVIRNQPKGFYTSEQTASKKESKKGGIGFLIGFVIGVLLLGIVGVGILGVIFLPSILAGDTNSKVNNPEKRKKTKIINDSGLVKVSASSSRRAEKGNFYDPNLAFDGNSRTAWCEGVRGAGVGQWIVFDFKKEEKLKEIIIEPGYFKTSELWRKNNRLAEITVTFSDKSKRNFSLKDLMKEQKIELNNVKTESVMITIRDIYPGQADSKDTLISEVRFVVEEVE
jgi:hypothetical protein